MPRRKTYIEGFNERLDEACLNTGLSKCEIARRCGFNRKQLMRGQRHEMMGGGDVARFCAVTKTDANWLLGISL